MLKIGKQGRKTEQNQNNKILCDFELGLQWVIVMISEAYDTCYYEHTVAERKGEGLSLIRSHDQEASTVTWNFLKDHDLFWFGW